MKLYISVDYSDKESKKSLPELTKFLRNQKTQFFLEGKDKNKKLKWGEISLVISFGNSFNVLRTFRALTEDIPVLGVSVYENEFLPEITLEQFKELFNKIINKEYSVEERDRIEIEINNKPLPPVLNEGVLVSRKSASTISYSLVIDGKRILKDTGDGIIISTPTGSTGYSASSGGPIILQEAKVISLTPLSSMRQNKPIVVSDDSIINIKNANSGNGLEIVCDGRFRYLLKDGDITIRRYIKPAKFVVINELKKSPVEKLKNISVMTMRNLEKAPPSAKFIVKLLQYEGQLTQKEIIDMSSLQIRTVRHGLNYLKSKGIIEERKSLRDARFSIYKLKN